MLNKIIKWNDWIRYFWVVIIRLYIFHFSIFPVERQRLAHRIQPHSSPKSKPPSFCEFRQARPLRQYRRSPPGAPVFRRRWADKSRPVWRTRQDEFAGCEPLDGQACQVLQKQSSLQAGPGIASSWILAWLFVRRLVSRFFLRILPGF